MAAGTWRARRQHPKRHAVWLVFVLVGMLGACPSSEVTECQPEAPVCTAGCDSASAASQSCSRADAAPQGDPDLGVGKDLGSPGDMAFEPPVCNGDRWSWRNPLPQGNSLYGVWGTDPSNIWAVGSDGTIV